MMHDMIHPGVLISEISKDSKISKKFSAKYFNIPPKKYAALLKGHLDIDLEIAKKLGDGFNVSAESWLTHQLHYHLSKAKKLESTINDLKNKNKKMNDQVKRNPVQTDT